MNSLSTTLIAVEEICSCVPSSRGRMAQSVVPFVALTRIERSFSVISTPPIVVGLTGLWSHPSHDPAHRRIAGTSVSPNRRWSFTPCTRPSRLCRTWR